MNTFIEDVLQNLKENDTDFSNIIFILPSKRAGVFLKSKLYKYINETSFAQKF